MLAESIDAKICRAIAALINADAGYFGAYYRGTARYIPPLISDDYINLPDLLIQNVLDRDQFNRLIGGVAKPSVHVKVLMWEPEVTVPYAEGNAEKIVNRIVALEALLEIGSLGQGGENTGMGKLIDPDSSFGDPAMTRYLNVEVPQFTRFAPQRVDISEARDQSSIAMVFPLVVSYVTQQNRLTRRPI